MRKSVLILLVSLLLVSCYNYSAWDTYNNALDEIQRSENMTVTVSCGEKTDLYEFSCGKAHVRTEDSEYFISCEAGTYYLYTKPEELDVWVRTEQDLSYFIKPFVIQEKMVLIKHYLDKDLIALKDNAFTGEGSFSPYYLVDRTYRPTSVSVILDGGLFSEMVEKEEGLDIITRISRRGTTVVSLPLDYVTQEDISLFENH